MYISRHCFKSYENIIVHYTGKNSENFLHFVSSTITDVILYFYENNILKKFTNLNYFYFSEIEKKQILDNTTHILNSNKKDFLHRKNTIFQSVMNFLKENKSIILDGFVNFRLSEYMKLLDETVDVAVDKLLIEREYDEFISLLKLYIISKESTLPIVHLIYSKGDSILLDEHKSLIDTSDNIFTAKYLSDISFSSNDYA